jgi:hypothetical protein
MSIAPACPQHWIQRCPHLQRAFSARQRTPRAKTSAQLVPETAPQRLPVHAATPVTAGTGGTVAQASDRRALRPTLRAVAAGVSMEAMAARRARCRRSGPAARPATPCVLRRRKSTTGMASVCRVGLRLPMRGGGCGASGEMRMCAHHDSKGVGVERLLKMAGTVNFRCMNDDDDDDDVLWAVHGDPSLAGARAARRTTLSRAFVRCSSTKAPAATSDVTAAICSRWQAAQPAGERTG